MSAPKRPNEEGSHSSPLKRPIEETGVFGLTGPREVDKRASLLNRVMPSPSNYLDHPVTVCKDARDAKSESRETRSEIRDLYSDPRINLPVVKAESEARLDNRGDPNELRADRGFYNDFKGDAKVERESYTASSSHINWKESIEHHRGKRYSESLVDNLDSWRVARHGLQNTVGIVNLRAEEWDSSEAREAVGENKVDMKGERKKEERHRDTGEREKDRNDRQNNLQLSEATHERKEETQRWERDRKGPQRDKEQNEREMDTGKGKSPSPNEKDSWHQDKDGSVRTFNQDVTASEIKKHKDDSWKVPDREFKDKKRARDTTLGDRHEQQGKTYHKELDDESAEGEGVTERDRDAFGNGIQQRRRMLRTRGSPQTPHREPQFPSRVRDEGSQGKHEVSTVVYKAGDCMQELLKAWKEFEASQEGKNEETCQNYRTLEIRIPAEYVTSSNRQVRGAQLWGTDIYTNDSDLFAVLMHTGYCRPTSSPPDAIQELRGTVRVLPPQEYYTSTLRNNVRSRAWGAGIGCSFRVERCCIVKKGGGTIDLEPRLTHISALEPTLAPVSVERTMTTRSAASNALRQQKFVREVSIQYNLCNEPWLKYSISVVADKGMKKPLYTSARLKKGEVLYLETHSKRYELCFNGEKAAARAHELEQEKRQNHSSHVQNGDRNLAECESTVDVFRWSRCKKILPEEMLLSTGIPLRAEDLEIIEDNLEWEDLQWSQTGVLVAGKMYALARVHFLAPKRK